MACQDLPDRPCPWLRCDATVHNTIYFFATIVKIFVMKLNRVRQLILSSIQLSTCLLISLNWNLRKLLSRFLVRQKLVNNSLQNWQLLKIRICRRSATVFCQYFISWSSSNRSWSKLGRTRWSKGGSPSSYGSGQQSIYQAQLRSFLFTTRWRFNIRVRHKLCCSLRCATYHNERSAGWARDGAFVFYRGEEW